jgi:hypothetical protein
MSPKGQARPPANMCSALPTRIRAPFRSKTLPIYPRNEWIKPGRAALRVLQCAKTRWECSALPLRGGTHSPSYRTALPAVFRP